MPITISFLNRKGGVGKTTSVLEFAYQLGKRGKSVLVVDLDPQGNATKRMCDVAIEDDKTIGNLILGTATFAEVIQNARDAWPNTAILPSKDNLTEAESLLDSNKKIRRDLALKKALVPAREIFDYILIDLGPALTLWAINAAVASTHYLVLTEACRDSFDGIRAVQKFVAELKDAEMVTQIECLGIIMTGFQKAITADVRKLVAEFETSFPDNPFRDLRITHSVKVQTSQEERAPLSLILPENTVSKSYATITETILERMAP